MNLRSPLRPSRWPWPAAVLLACLPAIAIAQTATPLDFNAARERMRQQSDKLAAAEAGLESSRLQSRALSGLGGPSVRLSAGAGRYHFHTDLDIRGLKQTVSSGLDDDFGALPLPVPLPPVSQWPLYQSIPNSIPIEREDNFHTQTISALWPIYTGGLTTAVKRFSGAQAAESAADTDTAAHELDSLLVQRYFSAQLARRAANLRGQVLQVVGEHDHAAQRMMEEGLIARVERLQAQVKLEDARREALKADGDAELAEVALQRLLKASVPLRASTPLFVNTRPVEPLAHFQTLALAHHPGLAKIAAKRAQAEQLHAVSASRLKPVVGLYGARQLQSGSEASWVAGVQASWTLWSSVDRRGMLASSEQRLLQVDYSDAEARNNIELLVEKNWRALEDARRQYLATLPGVELAGEVLRLRKSGLREGTSTTLDLIDAEVNFGKLETERAKAANDYAQALAALLESAGVTERFASYMRRADVHLPL